MKTISEFLSETDGYEKIHNDLETENLVLFFELLAKQQGVDFDEFVTEEIKNETFFNDDLLEDTYKSAINSYIDYDERHKDICLKYDLDSYC